LFEINLKLMFETDRENISKLVVFETDRENISLVIIHKQLLINNFIK